MRRDIRRAMIDNRFRTPLAVAIVAVIAILASVWIVAVTLRSHERFILPNGRWRAVQVRMFLGGQPVAGFGGRSSHGAAQQIVAAIESEHGTPQRYPSVRFCAYPKWPFNGPPAFLDVIRLVPPPHSTVRPYVIGAFCGMVLSPRAAPHLQPAIRELVKVPTKYSQGAIRRWLRDWVPLRDTSGVSRLVESVPLRNPRDWLLPCVAPGSC